MSEINPILLSSAEELLTGTPKSVRLVFYTIKKSNTPLKVGDIEEITRLTGRTVRKALRRLYSLKLVIKVPDLTDMRSHFLQLAIT